MCGKSLRGRFLLLRLTRRDRMVAKLKAVKEELRRRRHQPIPVQGAWLAQVVSGFFNYHAVPTNAVHSARSATGGGPLEALAPAAQPAGLHHLGADEEARLRLAAETTYPASMAE